MKKYLKDIVNGCNKLMTGEKIRNFNFPLESIRELQLLVSESCINGEAETINETVYRFAMYCGLKVQTCGIGWKVYARPAIGK